MNLESKPFAPGSAGDVVTSFPVVLRPTGVYLTPETAARFDVERVDRLTPAALSELLPMGVRLVGADGEGRQGLRIAVRRKTAGDGHDLPAVFRASVDLEADVGALEHDLGFVVERGVREAARALGRARG